MNWPPAAAREPPAPALPENLGEALAALGEDALYREKMGADFIDYIRTLKTAEIERWRRGGTDWEQREYFEMF